MTIRGRRSIETLAIPECLDEVHDLIRAVTAEGGVPEEAVIRFESAAVEVVGNVVEHAAVANSQVSVTVEIGDGWLRGIVEDDGAPAPVDLEAVAMPEELSDGGRGLAIAVHMLDDFTYERRQERNIWRLGVALTS